MGMVVSSKSAPSVVSCSTVKKRNGQQYPVCSGTTCLRGCDRYAGSSMTVTSLNNVALAVRTGVKCRGLFSPYILTLVLPGSSMLPKENVE